MSVRNGLSSWSAALDFLRPEVTASLEPMARRLDVVMEHPTPLVAPDGEPDGYDGLARRGTPHRMLLSEWALAEAAPEEFARRLAESEVSYLDVASARPKPSGRISVLIDGGPAQLGAPRVAQLAALIVLDRRARASGIPLAIGSLSSPAGEWVTGEFPEVYEAWMQSRSALPVRQATLDKWLAAVPEQSTLWMLGGEHLSTEGSHVRCSRFFSTETAWDERGVAALTVSASGRSVELEAPDREGSLRVLRGRGLRLVTSDVEGAGAQSAVRFAGFNGGSMRLLARGTGSDELVTMTIPPSADQRAGEPKARRFSGQVLAASVLGGRLVALVAQDGEVHVEVAGKKLGNVVEIRHRLDAFGLSQSDVDEIVEGGLAPLFFLSGAIVVKLGVSWLRIFPGSPRVEEWFHCVAAAPSPTLDQPRFAHGHGAGAQKTRMSFDGALRNDRLPEGGVVFGPGNLIAYETESEVWKLARRSETLSEIRIGTGEDVIGIVAVEGENRLLVRSTGGLLIRLHGPDASKTLTALSKDATDVALHPFHPIVAMQRRDGSVDVIHLDDGKLARVRGVGS